MGNTQNYLHKPRVPPRCPVHSKHSEEHESERVRPALRQPVIQGRKGGTTPSQETPSSGPQSSEERLAVMSG